MGGGFNIYSTAHIRTLSAAGRAALGKVSERIMGKCKPWQACLVCSSFVFIVAIVCLCSGFISDRRCSRGTYRRAAVSADSRLCSDIGRDMLQRGGSAVDGAIAALLCTSVVNPQSMGLGGGSIFTVMDSSGQVKVFSSRETVPLSSSAALLRECPSEPPTTGSKWIGVPGELRGYEKVHRLYGRLSWASLFEPTIRLARDGFPLPAFLGQQLSMFRKPLETSSLCEVFCNRNKTILRQGDTLRFPKLAETMETIAQQGADALYTGNIGQDLIHDIQDAGGSLTMEDLKSFQVRVEEAWTVPLDDFLMHIPPPPAGGAILAFLLNLMKGFHLTPSSMDGDQKVQTYHRYIEAAKFANGQRRNIRDPASGATKNTSYLLDPDFAEHIRAKISLERTHSDSFYDSTPSWDRAGTTHVSVLAEDGSAVSVTSTINHPFGAGVYSPRTGIILNNELADFCGRAESIRAGERPPSSMAPAILTSRSGDRTLVIGGSGGSMITTAMALSIINHLWLGKSLEEAINAPIIFVDGKNNVKFESTFDQSVIEKLKALGHRVEDWRYFWNVVNAIAKKDGCLTAVSDSRKMGSAAGF